MKKLWWAVGALILLCALSLWNSSAIHTLTDRLAASLTQAEALAGQGSWAQAEALTRDAMEEWENASGYLYTVLRHSDTNAIQSGFRQALAYLEHRDEAEYASASAELIVQIKLLADMEGLTLRNVL